MSFFAELKRRNVIRVGIAYVVVAWVVAQVAEFAFENFGAPEWVLKSVVVMLALGLPLVLVFAWAFELTPEGIKLEKEVDRDQSITAQTGRKLDRTIIVVLLVALAWFAWDKFGSPPPPSATVAETTEEAAEAEDALDDRSVAVLPFVAMSTGPDDEYFADGLTEEILNSLAQLPELLVTARTSAFSFKGQDTPLQEIAALLGVRHVVEGSVRRSGERLRVTAQLIRAADGFHLWSENYDSTSADMIEVQENIAEKIAGALDVVLDEDKREAMRRVGLRDPEAFTLYQKGLDYYERAHGEMDQLEALRLANEYFEQVMDRVPEFWEVYANHSDLYVHLLNDSVGEATWTENVTDETLADAYRSMLSDYEAASRFAPAGRQRYLAELDLAFLSGNWRGLAGRMEKALADPGCNDGNWTPMIASVLGYSARYYELAEKVLECDPLRTLSWYNASRARLWGGDAEGALAMAREGMETAPGNWLTMTLVQTLMANDLHDEAHGVINDAVSNEFIATVFQVMIEADRGDRDRLAPLLDSAAEQGAQGFFGITIDAWAGRRESANRKAAEIDSHYFGPILLWQLVVWCQCGAPWDMEATPNFAAKARDANLTWPPVTPQDFPLKDW